jgi:glucose-6-phosphate dehydrogenase assembly protein OpcA
VSFTPGIPVPIGGIERELGRLWEASGEGKTRASLINLAVYSENPESLRENTSIIQSIAGEHAMRAILIQANPSAAESTAEAWISMNCYLRGAKGGEVCSEQISFNLAGEAARSLQSVVFSHLDSDLPLVLWWQSGFRNPLDGKLWRWVDRLLFDSASWNDPSRQFQLIHGIADLTESRTVLCDLNWARSLPVRQALAGIFDCPETLPELGKIRSLHLDHAPGNRTTALLLTGWLADRLGWHLTLDGSTPQFQDASGGIVTLFLKKVDGASISRLQLSSDAAEFEVRREHDSDLYVSAARGTTVPCTSRMVRAPREETKEILLAELARGGRHPLYQRAVRAVEALMG